MRTYQIFSDGACDIPLATAEQNALQLIPFYVSLDHQTYLKEQSELSLKDFYHFLHIEQGFPKTSLPSVQDYIDKFTPALAQGKDIISCHVTHTLSGSVQSALTAKMILEDTYPDANIYIVDTWNATGSQALLLLEALRMQKDGKSADDVVAYLEAARADSSIIFIVGALKHLQHGGRIGKLASISGSILKIKPIIQLQDGSIHSCGVARSRKKGFSEILRLTQQHFQTTNENPANYIAMIGTTDDKEEALQVEQLFKQEMPDFSYLPVFHIGATIASHTGPGTLGICFVKKYEHYFTT